MATPVKEKHHAIQELLDNAADKSARGEISATAAAQQIDQLLDAEDEHSVEDFLWSLFTKLIKLASNLPPGDPRQKFLVNVLESLSDITKQSIQVWGNSHTLWTDLPLLGPCMREAFNLSPRFDGSDKDNAAVSEWVSLNAFCAQLLQRSDFDAKTYALWSMRSALEEALENSKGEVTSLATTLKRDTDIWVAHEWVALAGEKLWDNVQANDELDETAKRMLAPGSLYAASSPNKGEAGFSRERWEFWKQRLGDLGHEAEGNARERAEKAVAVMKELESR